jgi:hypothetical protein
MDMPKRSISLAKAKQVRDMLNEGLTASQAATKLGVSDRTFRHYRQLAEERLSINLPRFGHNPQQSIPRTTGIIEQDNPFTIIIFSDAHFWPDHLSPSYWILLQVLADIEPDIVVDCGDSFDGASISRHPSTTWHNYPSLTEEYTACKDALDGIMDAAGDARLLRVIGNHDTRFESYLTQNAPAVAGMPGTTISELFPDWEHKYSFLINDTLYIKHRWHGGTHAAYNNTVKCGKSIVTGHLHKLVVRPYTDLNGTRYGIEAGTIADIGDQFAYTEDNPLDWQQGFVVLTVSGSDVYPELVEVKGRQAYFRGKRYQA